MKRFDWRAALNEAVEKVRWDAGRGDWYMGYRAGASAVAVEMARLEREHKESPTPAAEEGEK